MFSLKVAYIPEHFATPLFFAEKNGFYKEKNIAVEFVPVPEGTGRLVKLLENNEVDIAVGLTEGFVADVAKGNESYKIIGSYVESPLCWAISTGYDRQDINELLDIKGKKLAVSRIGSGSYVMSFVLGRHLKLGAPFFSDYPVCSNFKNLRDSVNHKTQDSHLFSDAFMWEHFTSKKYFDNKEIKKIGEIYTPWPSWVITVHSTLLNEQREKVGAFLETVAKGIDYFNSHCDEAISLISSNFDYSSEDATEWIKTVRFNGALNKGRFDRESVLNRTASVLQDAGVLDIEDHGIQSRLEKGVVSPFCGEQ